MGIIYIKPSAYLGLYIEDLRSMTGYIRHMEVVAISPSYTHKGLCMPREGVVKSL